MSEANGRSSSARLAMGFAVAGVLLVAVLVPTARWTTHSSSLCGATCHEVTATHLTTPGHESVECQACHVVRVGSGLRLALRRLVGSRGGPEHGQTSATACAACHDSRDLKWVKIANAEGHRKHPANAKFDCLSCHRAALHAKQPITQSCLACHVDARLHSKATFDEGPTPQCLSCHNFSAPRVGQPGHAALTSQACGTCHAGDGGVPASIVRPEDLHGGVDCKLCHQPHDSLAAKRPCKSCHQIQLLSGNPNLPPEHLECEKCHVQHKPVAQAGAQCVHCHEQARAKSDGKTSTALRHDECASCHLPHTWVAAPNDCVTCHAKQATLVLTKSPAKHQRCTNCHEVHGAPPSGATCAKCHKENAAKMNASTAPPDHKKCIGCHMPHSPVLTVPQGCVECHQSQVHQLVSLGPVEHVKARCDGCHALHGDPKATTKNCASCHKNQAALVARGVSPPKHQQCASCHLAHKFSFDPLNPSCSVTCHKEFTPTSGTHNGTCTKCHTPHGTPAVARDKCLGCHEQKVHLVVPEKAPDHAKCSSCHKAHTPAREAKARCVTCHEEKAKGALLWPVRSAHRDACHECHKPHDVGTKNVVSCGECHQQQFAAAAGGKHACKQCHSPHQAPATDKSGWWNRCVSCHQKQVETSKKHNQCATCHQPHKFAPPACTSCHAEEASEGAHLVKDHKVCTKCHDAHLASKPSRAQCLACHRDKVDHEGAAKACYVCHPFISAAPRDGGLR